MSSSSPPAALRLGTRRSPLAQAQAAEMANRLRLCHPGLSVEIVGILTTGDRIPRRPPHNDSPTPNVKTLFTKELEDALLEGRIDVAVHSMKDLPGDLPDGLCLGAFPPREDPRDVWISRDGTPFAALPKGAVIGTSAVRRQAQLRHLRPDLRFRPFPGNIDTRLRKLPGSGVDGLVLALAGLRRLGLETRATEIFPLEKIIPAVGQGFLALEVRRDDRSTLQCLQALEDPQARPVALAERAFLKAMGGNCQTPLGAFARIEEGSLVLRGFLSGPQGQNFREGRVSGPCPEAELLGPRLAALLRGG